MAQDTSLQLTLTNGKITLAGVQAYQKGLAEITTPEAASEILSVSAKGETIAWVRNSLAIMQLLRGKETRKDRKPVIEKLEQMQNKYKYKMLMRYVQAGDKLLKLITECVTNGTELPELPANVKDFVAGEKKVVEVISATVGAKIGGFKIGDTEYHIYGIKVKKFKAGAEKIEDKHFYNSTELKAGTELEVITEKKETGGEILHFYKKSGSTAEKRVEVNINFINI